MVLYVVYIQYSHAVNGIMWACRKRWAFIGKPGYYNDDSAEDNTFSVENTLLNSV